MPRKEFCREGLFIRMVNDDEGCYVQVVDAEDDLLGIEAPKAQCDPLNLYYVLKGMKYHLAANGSLCCISRNEGEVIIEFEKNDSGVRACRLEGAEYESALLEVYGDRLDRGYLK
jgi:hypothetical protein